MSTNEDLKENSMNINEIMKIIPHRYPFLLVDRITEYVSGKYVKGYKNVTFNEPFFTGHFPEKPIMPGVLMVEALAQVSAGIVMKMPEYQGKFIVFAGIDNVRFKRIVIPGDRLDLYSEVLKLRGSLVKLKVQASVDGQIAVEGELICSVIDPENL